MPSIKDHPIIVVSGLIIAAFVAGISAFIWFDGEINRRIDDRLTSPIEQALPKGVILAYFSEDGNIPKGWAICNGNNGTPNLENKFIRGAVRFSDHGKKGGFLNHTLNIKLPRLYLATGNDDEDHDRALVEKGGSGDINNRVSRPGANLVNSFNLAPKEPIFSMTLDNQPPFISLVYIMKIEE